MFLLNRTCLCRALGTHGNVAVVSATVVQSDQPGISGRTGVFNRLHLRGQAQAVPDGTELNLHLNSR